jgi:hypothetical protein
MYKNTCTLKLLLNVVTRGIEALVRVSWCKILYALYQRSLPPVSSATFDTICELLIIVEEL